ncbi:MAG: CC0125/CC1285 family lipoprotein [Glycocaulis sp.]
MNVRLAVLAAFASAALAACSASQTVYGPAAGQSGRALGYDSLRIEQNRWRVSFTAGPDVSAAHAERLALRRAAELTLENGYDWFELVDRRIDTTGSASSPVRVGGSVGTAIGSGGYRSTGVGLGVGISPGQERRTIVSLEIIARSGDASDAANAYDARSLIAAIG